MIISSYQIWFNILPLDFYSFPCPP